jgi:hypothetical protein
LDNRVIEKYGGSENGQRYRIRKESDEKEKRIFLDNVYSGIRLIYEVIKKGEGNINSPHNVSSNYIEGVEKALSKVLTLNYDK